MTAAQIERGAIYIVQRKRCKRSRISEYNLLDPPVSNRQLVQALVPRQIEPIASQSLAMQFEQFHMMRQIRRDVAGTGERYQIEAGIDIQFGKKIIAAHQMPQLRISAYIERRKPIGAAIEFFQRRGARHLQIFQLTAAA